ncbi:acyltransferase [Sandarakinorhabdus sp.]|uniref:acyltransferase family protein n=1 Tax=Sandarakinorhabdus sp. TaxID=1916663 RepID=UPI00286D91B5|nr:acyltransferase [Sandarakinorhabdus sp.]
MLLARLRPGPGALRLLLALVVLVSHMSALNIGRPAVVLFFVLSGYWVSRRWHSSNQSITGFVMGRFLRVWPLFALVSGVTWLMFGAVGLPRSTDLPAGLLLLGSASRGDLLLSVDWSLDLELQFYLALPLMWLLVRRLSGLQLGLVAGIAWCVGIWLMTRGAWSFLLYLPAFAAGMWLTRVRWQWSAGPVLAGLALFAVIGAGLAAWPATRPLVFKADGFSPVLEQLAHLAWSLPLLPLVAWVLAGPSSARDKALGDASYALYLVHAPVIALLAALAPLHGMAFKLAALPIIAIVAYALFRWIDQPLEIARRHGPVLPWTGFAPLNLRRKRPN